MSGIVSMKEMLRDVKAPNPLPHVLVTPRSEKPKVLTQGTRAPINRQAERILRPVRDWTLHPPPLDKPLPIQTDSEKQALAAVKIAHNQNAELASELGKLRAVVKALKVENQRLMDLSGYLSDDLKQTTTELSEMRRKNSLLEKLSL